MRWQVCRYKCIGKLFKGAGAADKAGLSKATVELSNVRNNQSQILNEQ